MNSNITEKRLSGNLKWQIFVCFDNFYDEKLVYDVRNMGTFQAYIVLGGYGLMHLCVVRCLQASGGSVQFEYVFYLMIL
jgi:hypothetical protein